MQKTAYEMRIGDWRSDVCSSDLEGLCPQSFIGLSATSRTGSLRGWNVIGRSAARSGLASAQRQNGKQGKRDLHTVPFSIGYPQQAMKGNTCLQCSGSLLKGYPLFQDRKSVGVGTSV